jgi:hypothetical protein
MKNPNALCAVLISISALASSTSFADLRSSTIEGSITCVGKGFTVVMNQERTAFTVAQTREPVVFNVISDPEGDQRTSISYTGQLQLNHQRDEATLTFSNLGDVLAIGGKNRPMRCPE